ncbi:MAG: Unknown protein [uncultured Sulfurovum sp.]|uniref:Uncharacterized protein n=1 Tax=uncultured Sulfurovum sp. TaxID=269237 RepID=A0A6S6TN38_9BACT|nr:MAG: Unknown protein [uncultured Sulfurovum sp.]
MAKLIILFFLMAGSSVSYLTYTGMGQEKLETLETESIRSNSYRTGGSSSSWGGGSSSYNSSGYSYGK